MSDTERVREWVETKVIQPARARGDRVFTVTAGDVHRQLGLKNRVPVVCQALKSKRFLQENHLVLKDMSGPPSGLSTTVRFTYEIVSGSADRESSAKQQHPLLGLRGVAKDIFRQLGGGEHFIKQEREQFSAAVGEQRTPEIGEEAEFERVWQSVVAHAGEKFSTSKGLLFRYVVAGHTVKIERDGRIVDQALATGEFRKAWQRWPVSGPGELNDVVRGPAYIFAILSDARIWKEAGR